MALWQSSRSAQRGLEDRRIERPIRRHRSPTKSEPQVALVWKKSSSVPSFQHVKIIHLNTNYGLTGRLNWSLVSPQRAVGTTSQQRLDVFVFAAAYRDRLPLFDMRNYGSTAVSILFFSLSKRCSLQTVACNNLLSPSASAVFEMNWCGCKLCQSQVSSFWHVMYEFHSSLFK